MKFFFYIHVNFLANFQSADCAWIAQYNQDATGWMTGVRLSSVEGYVFATVHLCLDPPWVSPNLLSCGYWYNGLKCRPIKKPLPSSNAAMECSWQHFHIAQKLKMSGAKPPHMICLYGMYRDNLFIFKKEVRGRADTCCLHLNRKWKGKDILTKQKK